MKEIDKVTPTADNIFIEPELHNAARKTESGLYLTDRMTTDGKKLHQTPKAGRVAAVGPEVPDYIKIGMRVVINVKKVEGVRFNRDEGYLIVKPDEVIGEVIGDGHIE